MTSTIITLRLCAKLLEAIGEHDAATATQEAIVLAEAEEIR